MACINVHIKNIVGSLLSATMNRIGSGLSVVINKAASTFIASATISRNEMNIAIDKVTPLFLASAIDVVQKHLAVKTSIVCTLSEVVEFLNVTPEEIQWITDDMGVFFDVESNVDWIIVTS